jgi:hypothetical protein
MLSLLVCFKCFGMRQIHPSATQSQLFYCINCHLYVRIIIIIIIVIITINIVLFCVERIVQVQIVYVPVRHTLRIFALSPCC